MIRIVSKPYKNFGNTNPELYNVVVDIEGLEFNGNGVYSGQKDTVKVDVDIADIIIKFNEMGFITSFSCSGLCTSHNQEHVYPYLSFSKKNTRAKSKKLVKIFEEAKFNILNVHPVVVNVKESDEQINAKDDYIFILKKWNNLRKKIGL